MIANVNSLQTHTLLPTSLVHREFQRTLKRLLPMTRRAESARQRVKAHDTMVLALGAWMLLTGRNDRHRSSRSSSNSCSGSRSKPTMFPTTPSGGATEPRTTDCLVDVGDGDSGSPTPPLPSSSTQQQHRKLLRRSSSSAVVQTSLRFLTEKVPVPEAERAHELALSKDKEHPQAWSLPAEAVTPRVRVCKDREGKLLSVSMR